MCIIVKYAYQKTYIYASIQINVYHCEAAHSACTFGAHFVFFVEDTALSLSRWFSSVFCVNLCERVCACAWACTCACAYWQGMCVCLRVYTRASVCARLHAYGPPDMSLVCVCNTPFAAAYNSMSLRRMAGTVCVCVCKRVRVRVCVRMVLPMCLSCVCGTHLSQRPSTVCRLAVRRQDLHVPCQRVRPRNSILWRGAKNVPISPRTLDSWLEKLKYLSVLLDFFSFTASDHVNLRRTEPLPSLAHTTHTHKHTHTYTHTHMHTHTYTHTHIHIHVCTHVGQANNSFRAHKTRHLLSCRNAPAFQHDLRSKLQSLNKS